MGVTVRPGDIVVGDGDGVVAVKKENLPLCGTKSGALTKARRKENVRNYKWKGTAFLAG